MAVAMTGSRLIRSPLMNLLILTEAEAEAVAEAAEAAVAVQGTALSETGSIPP